MCNELMDKIIAQVTSLPINEVIGDIVTMKGHGNELDGLCPFHNDRRYGSFKVNIVKNCWKCFSCGAGGRSGVSFYQQLYNLSYLDAIFEVGYKHNIISYDKYKEYKSSKLSKTNSRAMPILKEVVNYSGPETQKASPYIIDRVYDAFIEAAGPMPEQFKAKLIKERNLKRTDLRSFFVFPSNTSAFWNTFLTLLKKRNLNSSVLSHVPGFFKVNRTNELAFCNYAGKLAIIAKDESGLINGIQVRIGDDSRKYVWFSSGFADADNEKVKNGTKNSNVIDVLPGRNPNYIVCTEGKFKALKLQELGLYTLNMHGVSSWQPEFVDRIAKRNNCKHLLLCYDSDLLTNDSVAKSAYSFSSAMNDKGYAIQFLTWNPDYGKGFDDVVNAGCINEVKRLNYSDFLKMNFILNEEKRCS